MSNKNYPGNESLPFQAKNYPGNETLPFQANYRTSLEGSEK